MSYRFPLNHFSVPLHHRPQYYQRALSLAEQYGNTWAASQATRHLAGLSMWPGSLMSRDQEQGLRYALRSLALREEMGFKVYVPSAQLLISDICIERGDLVQALDYCQQAEQLCEEMNLQHYLMSAHLTRGDLAYKRGFLGVKMSGPPSERRRVCMCRSKIWEKPSFLCAISP